MTPSIPQHLKESILEKVNVVDLIAQYLPLKKAGSNWIGVCPFHGDKDPSFSVNEARQFFHCFGCGESGDAIAFMMKFNGYTFVEAMTGLSEITGIELEMEEDRGQPRRAPTKDFVAINEIATAFFTEKLASSAEARAYVEGRGLDSETVERFSLGYAPADWGQLTDRLATLGRDALSKAESLGLIRAKKSGNGYFDLFRDRLQFPVRNQDGRIVGFSGRTLGGDPEAPKYVNSPDSHLYHKGKLLFGLAQARDRIRLTKRAIVVEGNVDVLAMHQAGFTETVAPLGTALTSGQALLLKRVAEDIVLLFDGDPAGLRAADKSLRVFLQASLHPRIALLPTGEDPDSFLQGQGSDALAEILKAAPHGLDLLIDRFVAARPDSEADRARAFEAILPFFDDVQSGVERELYVQRLLDHAGLDRDHIQKWAKNWSVEDAELLSGKASQPREQKWAIDLFRVCVDEPLLLEQLSEERLALIDMAPLRALFVAAAESAARHGRVKPEILSQENLPGELKHRLAECFMAESKDTESDRLSRFQALIGRLQKARWERDMDVIQTELKRLHGHHDEKWSEIKDLVARKQEIMERVRIVNDFLDRVSGKGSEHVQEVH